MKKMAPELVYHARHSELQHHTCSCALILHSHDSETHVVHLVTDLQIYGGIKITPHACMCKVGFKLVCGARIALVHMILQVVPSARRPFSWGRGLGTSGCGTGSVHVAIAG